MLNNPIVNPFVVTLLSLLLLLLLLLKIINNYITHQCFRICTMNESLVRSFWHTFQKVIMPCRLPLIVKGKGKDISIIGHERPRGMWMQGSTYSKRRPALPPGKPPVLIL